LKFLDHGVLLDFGCGARAFQKHWEATSGGEDIRIYSYDPYFYPNHNFLKEEKINAITFWDSFEHISRLSIIPEFKADYLILTLPIIDRVSDIFTWKHYVPYEHTWLFSTKALQNLLHKWGYHLIEHSNLEADLRSPDVHSFCFNRNFDVTKL